MNPCYLSSETFDQHPDSVDPVFDQSEWPEGTQISGTYNTYGQRVRYVGRDDLPLALAYDAAGLDAFLLYGAGTPEQGSPNASLGYLSTPWYLITGFDVQNFGGPDPIPDDWRAIPEYSNTNTSVMPLVEIVQFGGSVSVGPGELELSPDGLSVLFTFNGAGGPEDTPPVATARSLLNQAMANQKVRFASTGVWSTADEGFSGEVQLENSYTDFFGGYELRVGDYYLQARLADFAWQGAWTMTGSVVEYEVDETLRDLDFVGAKDGAWQTDLLDFDITANTDLRTVPGSDPAEQEFYLDLNSLRPTLGDLERFRLGWRDDVAGGLANYLNYPGLGIDALGLSGVYPADFLDFNAIIPSAAYTAMVPAP